ncbi:MAG TPA: transcription antitermination factor NusB [Chitinophagaceae bacterium]|nr:transcription antitermination factor NusB [Chitinophagaceae bacterium]
MISRRNIRVKVMQTLYTVTVVEHDGKNPVASEGKEPAAKTVLDPDRATKLLFQHFDQTRSLLVYLLYYLTELARYAQTDAHQRAGKHLPTTSDLHVNTKIVSNEWLRKMEEDPALQKQFAKEKPQRFADKELLRRIYHQLEETPEYITYTRQENRERSEEKNIIEFILNDLMLANEAFVAHIEENFVNWDDDGDMLVQLLAGYIQKPGSIQFNAMLSADKQEFARSLLVTVMEKGEQLQSLIIPKLKNWDPERIALLDMIMMKMGVAEFLFFETIPPKVTINEYIDLAKEYSTTQSGQFVNGILDNIHKDLVQQGKMQKIGYKKA